MPRLNLPKYRVTISILQAALEGMSFSCGAPLQNLELPSDLINTMYVRSLNFHDSLYYNTKYEPISV